jgi:hypothetical protein
MTSTWQQIHPVQLPTDRETPLQAGRNGVFGWRCAYSRSADSRAVGDPGQDYLTFDSDEQAFVFALCDGVSQSFYGGLAARLLGDALMAWLVEHLPRIADPAIIRQALGSYLEKLTAEATRQTQRHALPPDIPPMLRDVLETKRAIGSQSTFLCGRLELQTLDHPEGRLVLAWMGDSRLRLWGPDGERDSIRGETFDTDQRWSTREGLVGGEPNVFATPMDSVGKSGLTVLAYSDGLAALDGCAALPSDASVQELLALANESATSDDIAFLEVSVTR